MALRFQSSPNAGRVEFTDVPIPTHRPPLTPTNLTIRRAKTLTRPERGVAPSIGGMRDKNIRQAWREKMALYADASQQPVIPSVPSPAPAGVQGRVYNISNAKSPANLSFPRSQRSPARTSLSTLIVPPADFPKCAGLTARAAVDAPCTNTPLPTRKHIPCVHLSTLGFVKTSYSVGYDWDQVALLDITFGKDGTRFSHHPGCYITSLFLYVGLIVILGLVMLRFVMAIFFNWFMSKRLAGNPDSRTLNRSAISPAVMPEGANLSVDNKTEQHHGQMVPRSLARAARSSSPIRWASASSHTLVNSDSAPIMSLAQIGAELFAVCLVTCYSEGEESLRTTLDAISLTHYSDARKLLFVKRSTPDLSHSMMYSAVGSGSKATNRAMVYAGHYTVAGRRTPTVVVVKCGTEAEAASERKPGNRGKRDSQLILMNFFSRVTYNDRMTPLEFDLFRKIHILMGVTPDFFEVDADTKTRIANKRTSWVTAIQVFEYFISHHLAKAFDPCRKATGDDWVPLIIKPEIVKEYSQNEDRFLTTILLRTSRTGNDFLPQARHVLCPPFQRRRWINSTIHNLMELVLVRNLCGTFCFSMQFVVFMDLLGTVVLPIAIALTYILIVGSALAPPKSFEEAIPLVLLIAVLGLPAILILITTRKIVYVFWMLIYLLALPVWNFLLPVYAFWHFDDFSWGRPVEGEQKGEGHGSGGGAVGAEVPLRRWEDWERSRLRKLRREERRRRDFERAHPSGYMYDGSDTISVNSSDDDHWGTQIGGYNEHNAKYPPPPVGLLLPQDQALQSAETLDTDELEAMLEMGFDERPSQPPPSMSAYAPRYQLQDGASTAQLANVSGNGYAPLIRSPTHQQQPLPNLTFSPTTPTTPMSGPGRGEAPVRRGTGERYGPLGPLDPATRF
ncbi:chitin synthase-domain-containing protein [Mycena sp. CBHHK59/15]|nr:chitin synthase-domain-containing protein [Mycena sp. CBHHK59/15]